MQDLQDRIERLKVAVEHHKSDPNSKFWPTELKSECLALIGEDISAAELARKIGLQAVQLYAWNRKASHPRQQPNDNENYQVLEVEDEPSEVPMVLLEVGSFSFYIWRRN